MPEFPILSLSAETTRYLQVYAIYAAFDLFKFPWYVSKRNLLLRRCFEEANPSTLYVKGVEYFSRLDRHVEGLALIKRAAGA
ncbi:unnamed protein product [Brassica oleracea var. botrytis]|uniref:At2g35280-like TPR domain-containing protein n=1 Tax=Brassica oleracea TaxID=3712 RepID=A0A3P6DHP9_BRAOL|nr:unnamed protein product [Brassica oleracea]